MFLILDNTEKGENVFYFWVDNKFVQRKIAGSILPSLDKLLGSLKLKLKDIECLGVVTGAGQFTASRLAVTAVNTLAYGLNIPVVALPKNFDEALALKLAKSARPGSYVVPTYSGEARIG